MAIRSIVRLPAAFLSQCFLARTLAVLLAGAGCLSVIRAQGSGPADVGAWTGPFDWSSQVGAIPFPEPAGDDTCVPNTIGHAALIPTGAHRGKVLLWSVVSYLELPPPSDVGGACDVTTKTFLFDPASPSQLIEINQSLESNIFCSGTTWDPDGNLLVIGGEDIVDNPGPSPAPGAFPKKAYRFLPGALGSVSGSPPTISGSPWIELGDLDTNNMSIARNYPTALTLLQRPFVAGSCSWLEGASFVLGGRAASTEGCEVWDFLNRGATTWSCALRPQTTLPSIYLTDPAFFFAPHTLPPSFPTAAFTVNKPTGDPDTDYPEVDFESYPRGFQITTGQIIVTGDVDKAEPPINSSGHAWVIKPHYPQYGTPSWELWRAPSTATEWKWGTAVIMHMWNPGLVPEFELNRLFILGGDNPNPPTPATLETVREFIAGPNPPSAATFWYTLPAGPGALGEDLNHARTLLNAVVLPTGHIFVHGGHDPRVPVALGGGPQFAPELYDPGRTQFATASSQDLAQPNDVPGVTGPNKKIPRRSHHVTVLLPDGRVFVAGGDFATSDPYPDSRFNGEIYEPPYLHQGFRPVITQRPGRVDFYSPSSPTFSITAQVSTGNTVERVVLIRPAAVTHHFDGDQRYIELPFSGITVTPPPPLPATVTLTVDSPEADIGPPGHYMLFVVERRYTDGELVPSVAAFIDLQ